MWVADASHANDSSSTASTVEKGASAKANRKFRFVGANARKGLGAVNQENASAGAGPSVDEQTRSSGPRTTGQTAMVPLLGQNVGLPYPTIEEVFDSDSDQAIDPQLSQAVQEPQSADSLEASASNIETVEQQQHSQDLPSIDFTAIPPSSSLPLLDELLPMDPGPVPAVTEGEFLDLGEMGIGGVGIDYQLPMACDIQQQNIWSPLLDFPRTPTPARPPVSISIVPDPMSWTSSTSNYEGFLHICKSTASPATNGSISIMSFLVFRYLGGD